MGITWRDTTDGIDWQELEAMYRAAPLGNKDAALLRTVFGNSQLTLFVFDGDQLVGAGRVLSDGGDFAYICDVAFLPSHQGGGLGSEMLRRALDFARGHRKIMLYSVPGKEGFYRRFGFARMSSAMAIFTDQAAAQARGYLSEA